MRVGSNFSVRAVQQYLTQKKSQRLICVPDDPVSDLWLPELPTGYIDKALQYRLKQAVVHEPAQIIRDNRDVPSLHTAKSRYGKA